MQNTLIDNSSENLTMTNILRRCISTPGLVEMKIATGYWDIPGIALVVKELNSFLAREDTKLKLVIGREMMVYANQVLTPRIDPTFPQDFMRQDMERLSENIKPEYQETVRLLLSGCESGKIEIRKYDKDSEGNPQFLHSKCYIFNGVSAEGEKYAFGIIGSSNFTEQGLTNFDKNKGNRELNYLETNKQIVNFKDEEDKSCKGHNQWFDEIWEMSEPWNETYLEQVLKPAKITQELPPEEPDRPQDPSLTPYEAYIRLLNDRFGALTNDDMEAILRGYLPAGINPYKFQLDAATLCTQVMHQHGGFLLGDVVGLGKTIVGVLVLKYYLDMAEDEGRARKALIIVPPAIKSSWEKTIAQFDEAHEDKIEPFVDYVTTGSISKLVEGEEDIDEDTGDFETPLKKDIYGLILIDESHNFRNSSTQKYEMLNDLIEEINLKAGYYPYMGLLSATIQNNSPEDLRNQIYLFQRHPKESTLAVEGHNLDYFFVDACDRYRKIISEHPTNPTDKQANREALIFLSKQIHDKVLAELLVRRTRTDIKNDYKEDLHFPEVKGPVPLEYQMNERLAKLFYDSMELIAPGEEAIALGAPGIVYMRYRATEYLNKDLQKRYSGRNMSPEKSSSHLARIMQMLLVKRLESSFTAFRESLENLQRYTRNMIQMWEDDCIFICPQIDVNAELNLAEKQKRNPNYTKEQCYDDIRKKIAKLTKEGRNAKQQNAEYRCADFNELYYDLLVEDIRYIDELVNRWKDERSDPKLLRFNRAIYEELFDKQKNAPQKLVVFSEAIATVKEIKNALEDAGKRVLMITAANRNEKEKTIRANFDANYEGEWENDYDAIVTTEVLAEGVNLHRANTILNYDTPWNSTRLIQRIGRVNRIGSVEKNVYVYNFFPSAQGNETINLMQRAFTKLQSFHTLFGEDNQIFTNEEEVSHVDYMKLVNGQETPFTKYITELQSYKRDYPERYEFIQSLEAPICSAFKAKETESLYVVKTDMSKAGSVYVQVDSTEEPKAEIIPCLDMFQHCACAIETLAIVFERDAQKEQKAIDAYNQYMYQLNKAATNQNKFITAAKGFIRSIIGQQGLSKDAKERLNIASKIIGKGNIALAKKVCKLEQQYKDIQLSLFESSADDKIARINAIIEEELHALTRKMIERNGEPYIYFYTNKVNN